MITAPCRSCGTVCPLSPSGHCPGCDPLAAAVEVVSDHEIEIVPDGGREGPCRCCGDYGYDLDADCYCRRCAELRAETDAESWDADDTPVLAEPRAALRDHARRQYALAVAGDVLALLHRRTEYGPITYGDVARETFDLADALVREDEKRAAAEAEGGPPA